MAGFTPSLKLNNGHQIPQIGLGTWQSSDEEAEAAVEAALEAGYRMIDTAYVYRNEAVIGRVLKKWFDSGRLTREQVFITTKLPFNGMHADKVTHFLELSLKNLGLDYIDMYLIHNPVGTPYIDHLTILPRNEDGSLKFDMTTNLEAIWKAMEEQVRAGRTKSIGVSNFSTSQVDRIIKIATIKPANHQLELHAYIQQKPVREQAKKHGIIVTSYSSLGSAGRQESNITNLEASQILKHPTVQGIAKAHNKSTAQVLLKHLMQHRIVVIPKSVKKERVQQNIDVMGFTLSAHDMEQLDALDQGAKGRTSNFETFCPGYKNHPENPFDSY